MKDILVKLFGTSISDILDGIGNMIDKIDKSDDKLAMQQKFKELVAGLSSRAMDYESQLLEAQRSIIDSEAKGQSWLQRNWRPILMLVCIWIIFSNYILAPYFSVPVLNLDQNIWDIMKLGIGGYIGGRSLEKIASNLGPVLTNKPPKNS